MLTGPDVSEHQGDVDWRKVAAKHELAVVRVSDGDHRDAFYGKARVEAVRDAGLLLAPYYFARVASPLNSQRDGRKEAAMVLKFAKEGGWKWPGDLPLVYDFETDNGQPPEKCARHVVQFVKAYNKSEGHYPGLYTMPGFWERILPHLSTDDRRLIRRCFLHQAEWGVEGPKPLDPWKGAMLWQWTDHGRCSGVTGNVDMNRSIAAEVKILALAKRTTKPISVAEEQKEEKQRTEEEKAGVKRPKGVPRWVPEQHWEKWLRPWDSAAIRSSAFRNLCWKHGLASPNFTRKETSCHDPANTPVPTSLVADAQRHAFNLEKLRHELGDKPLPVLSWYRTTSWNAAVGGVSGSRHLQADGSDFTTQTVASFGASKFDATCERVFASNGFGRYPSGSRHADSRGVRARW